MSGSENTDKARQAASDASEPPIMTPLQVMIADERGSWDVRTREGRELDATKVALVEAAIAKEVTYMAFHTNLRLITAEELHFIACVAVEVLTMQETPA